MPNRIFEEILLEEIETFKNSFSNVSKKMFHDPETNKLIHSGEFGMYREAIAKKFLRFFVPVRLEIDQGFLLNSINEVSTQCDIVIYDKNVTPLIRSNELQRFYPVETVCSVGEIKSILSFNDFKNALLKLATTKKMSEQINNPSIIYRQFPGNFNPKECHFDLITTFIICQKFDFNIEKITEVYDDTIEVRHRCNAVLSIDDGLLAYQWPTDGEIGIHIIPTIDNIKQLNWGFYSFKEAGNSCFKVFCNYLFNALCYKTILLPEINSYMYHPGRDY